VLLLLACAIDNDIDEKDDAPFFETGVDTGADTDGTDTDTTVEELCNGVDDDGDGAIDEGFPDDDGNGRADCVDGACPPLTLGEAGEVSVPDVCDGADMPEVTDPWSIVVKWTWTAPAASVGYTGSYSTPTVANVDDDNGDGRVDDRDDPDVLIVTAAGSLTALEGATGAEKWTVTGIDGRASVVVGDVDADGWPDIVTGGPGARVLTFEGDGTPKWTAATGGDPLHTVSPVLADLEGDGSPEVLDDRLVLHGLDGTLAFDLGQSLTTYSFRMPAVGDVDRDGDQEIAFNGKLFDSDGTELWDSGVVYWYGLWPVMIQADGDDEAEIAFVGDTLGLYNADGTEVFEVAYAAHGYSNVPCAGDFDGDGAAELAFAATDTMHLYELDGTLAWSTTIEDSSGLSGCSGWDPDNDGALEILYGDQQRFVILDGRTGAVLYEDTSRDSQTLLDYPTVADLDGDGHGEILVVNDSLNTDVAVTVYEHAGGGWPAAGRTWPVHDFAITNVTADHSISAAPEASWLTTNTYRARPAVDDPALPDLVVSIQDQCVADCDYGPVAIAVQVSNQGARRVDAGAILTVYADDDTGERLVATIVLPEVPGGTALDGIEIPLTVADLGQYGWIVRVDEANVIAECDDANNEDRWTDVACP
jgi:hypothetical protein